MSEQETAQFRATSGDFQGFGVTPQEALNALLARLSGDAPAPIVIWPYNRGDAFFTAEQQARLQELKSRRGSLTEAERQEWERLAETALEGSIARTQALTTGYDETEARSVPLFHPRLHQWNEHFQFDSETNQIQGRTPTGCATVARLKMNTPIQLRARQEWKRMGLYP